MQHGAQARTHIHGFLDYLGHTLNLSRAQLHRRAMRFLPLFLFPGFVLLVLAACGGGSHPLAGTWQRQGPAAGGSMQLMFDKDSDKVLVCRKQADGTDTDLCNEGVTVCTAGLKASS